MKTQSIPEDEGLNGMKWCEHFSACDRAFSKFWLCILAQEHKSTSKPQNPAEILMNGSFCNVKQSCITPSTTKKATGAESQSCLLVGWNTLLWFVELVGS